MTQDRAAADAAVVEAAAEVQALQDAFLAEEAQLKRAIVGAGEEIASLRATINALREDLEHQRQSEQARIAETLAAAQAEINRLRVLADRLRQGECPAAEEEIRGLRQTVDSQRSALEEQTRRFEDERRRLLLAHAHERAHFQEMLAALRDRAGR